MTLLELTVVILVLLLLITVLFVGARAWKRGSDRTANILNIRNVQQAVRAHSNMTGLIPGSSTLHHETLFAGSDADSSQAGLVGLYYLPEPKPPSASGVTSYTYLNVVPEIGQLYIQNPTLGDSGYFYSGSSGDSFGGIVKDW